MKKVISVVLFLAGTFNAFAASEMETSSDVQDCSQSISKISNADKSIFRVYEMSCENMLAFVVTFQKPNLIYNSTHEEIVLNDVVLNPSRGANIGINFKDFNNDGIFEIDYVRGCGTANCRHNIYKLKEKYFEFHDAKDYIYLLMEEDSWYHLDIKEDYLVAHSRDSIVSYYSRIYLFNDNETQLPISYEVHNMTHVDSVKYCLIKKYIQSDSKVNNDDSFVFLTKEDASEEFSVFLSKEKADEEFKNLCSTGSIFTVNEPKCTKSTPC